ncbi:Response regulator MprA [Alphaproteobacteria bacterium SO-S41]|nr:Response regulator MprA [Alphaproteobacteria bacterium SO-S41]
MVNILIIDDEPGIRDLLRRSLTLAGHVCSEAEDGAKGIAAFVRERPDLVITDIIMPSCDGIQAIIAMRHVSPDVPIIAVSGGGQSGPRSLLELAGDVGASACMTKPFSLRLLHQIVGRYLPAEARSGTG